MREDILKFIADCEQLLSVHGATAAAFSGGTLRSDARVFDSPGLRIVAGTGQELEISVRYVGPGPDDTSIVDNPVVMRAADGTIFRTHGEMSYGKKRLARLLAGERPESPIRIGKTDGMVWVGGLD